MSMKGIDISHWQDGIDLSGVPCDFVIIKATQGTAYVDKCCDKFYQKAKKLGKKLGVYHYFGGGDPVKEADHFIKNIKGYIGEAILILDWEGEQNSKFRQGAAVAKPFLDRVYEVTGVKPLIYMSKSVCREYNWSSVVAANYGLWMAQYANEKPTGYQDDPWTDAKGMGAFKSYAIHQYSSKGRIGNYNGNLDLDIAYMNASAWDLYAKPTKEVQIVEYYPKYEETLVKVLDAMDIDSSKEHRTKIAAAHGISRYTGTAAQNTKMLTLLKRGKLVKP